MIFLNYLNFIQLKSIDLVFFKFMIENYKESEESFFKYLWEFVIKEKYFM